MTYETDFNPRASVPDYGKYQLARGALNEAARAFLAEADVAYGDHERHRLDVYQPAHNAHGDVHIYFHGGYWRAGDKGNFGFLAQPLADRGVAVVVPNYVLCGPEPFERVLASAEAALSWVVAQAPRRGWSPARITLSGHSAGAYLCAHLLASRLNRAMDGGADLLGATLVSGVYTPRVAIGTSVNAELGFTLPHIDRFDLAHRPWRRFTPATLFAGGAEPDPWIAMSRDYAQALRAQAASDAGFELLAGHDHFSILDEYRAGGRIHEAVLARHAPAPRP